MTGGPLSVHTVAAGRPFVDVLAQGLRARFGDAPDALAEVRVLLPTRRACRALRDAFLRQSGGTPLLLPRMTPLGDLEAEDMAAEDFGDAGGGADLPPAVDPLRRQLLLARLVRRMEGADAPPERAVRLAGELGRLLDQVQTERLSFGRLAELAPDRFAAHWQETLTFLSIVTEAWPEILAEEGALDPAARRNRLLEAQAALWRETPPEGPVIAAGSTGTVPATADLLQEVAGSDRGHVVLPGLDTGCDDATWAALDPQHPQYGMKKLLDRFGVDRAEVGEWHGDPGPQRRFRLVQDALRPSATTDAWRDWAPPDPHWLEGVRRIDCPTPKEEAAVIALHLREVLEHGEQGVTAALVTPDRDLARRVAAEMRRWGVEIDDSAGTPLDRTPPGGLLRLVAAMVAAGFAPVPLLAALKHPLAAGGVAPGTFRAWVRDMETDALRGPRPAAGLDGLSAAVRSGDGRRAVAALARAVGPFAALFDGKPHALGDLLRAHVAAAESLAASDADPGTHRLWQGEAGEAAAAFVADLDAAASAFEPLHATAYPDLLDALMAGRPVRPVFGRHPRLAILGPLEARLLQADLLVLGGLNEGTWPGDTPAGPWMSRPMMADFGLPPPERRIGLAAHDFVQGFCAPRVLLTRSERVDGTPTIPSRWLLRLEVLLAGSAAEEMKYEGPSWLDWQARLDEPERTVAPGPPLPRPPVAARPRKLSVTQVETWMRDPYAVYARHVLGLSALDPLDADPGAADYGTFIHAALERFVAAHPPPGALPEESESLLLEMGRAAFGAALARPGVQAFWWPRFERIAAWFVEQETERRAAGLQASTVEATGKIDIEGPAGSFEVIAKADRIDRLADGGYVLIDYKTGAVPRKKEVSAGYAPQLPLEGAMVVRGGFPGLAPGPVSALEHWRLRGGGEAGRRESVADDPTELIAAAYDGLTRLIATYDFEETAYPSVPRPEAAPRYNDYEHLARVREWSTVDDGEDAG